MLCLLLAKKGGLCKRVELFREEGEQLNNITGQFNHSHFEGNALHNVT